MDQEVLKQIQSDNVHICSRIAGADDWKSKIAKVGIEVRNTGLTMCVSFTEGSTPPGGNVPSFKLFNKTDRSDGSIDDLDLNDNLYDATFALRTLAREIFKGNVYELWRDTMRGKELSLYSPLMKKNFVGTALLNSKEPHVVIDVDRHMRAWLLTEGTSRRSNEIILRDKATLDADLQEEGIVPDDVYSSDDCFTASVVDPRIEGRLVKGGFSIINGSKYKSTTQPERDVAFTVLTNPNEIDADAASELIDPLAETAIMDVQSGSVT